MITVEEAKRILMAHVRPARAGPVPLGHADGSFLAEDVLARHPYPLFDMSAVDGYAIRGTGPWSVIGRIPAGETLKRALMPNECARIFTGAQVPDGTEAVVMQERCSTSGETMSMQGSTHAPGANIRRKGEGHARGDLLFAKGRRIDAVMIGMLASDGRQEVQVHAPLNTGILCTGGEFIPPGQAPGAGRIFSSNEHMLERALAGQCQVADNPLTVGDDRLAIRTAVDQLLRNNEVIVTTGGASVGDHDLMAAVLQDMGAIIHFHGVAQKPGKPMLFATFNGKAIFGLPGNPRAVMVCFWEYVLPFLRASQGASDPWLRSETLPLTHLLQAKGDRAEFRAARVRAGQVSLLPDEGSHMLRSLIEADALAYLPANTRSWNAGDAIEVHYLPGR